MKKFCFIILILFLSVSCEKKESAFKTLRTSIYSDPQSLDTRKAGDYISSEVLFMLYRGLMHYTAKGELALALCKRYEVSKDKKTYIFHLRKAFWSNKKPITAFNLDLLFQPDWNSRPDV